MTPVLVPTLAELDIELHRTVAAFDAAASAHHAQPNDSNYQDAVAHAALEAFEVVTQIIHLRAASIPDLRVKARALAQLFTAVPDSRPEGIEQRGLCQQIIDGLMDERIV
jgi:hypothetical protein